MLSSKYWFRLGSLLFSLTVIAALMYWLKNPSQPKNRRQTAQTLNICPTRVSQIQFKNEWTLKQSGRDWVMEFPDRSPLTLNPVSVEKWLARNCMLNVMNLGVYSELNPPPTLMKIQYVKGEPSTIYQRENGDFVNWELNVFQSTQLQNAIQELIGLAVP